MSKTQVLPAGNEDWRLKIEDLRYSIDFMSTYYGEHKSLDTRYNLKSEINIHLRPKVVRRTPSPKWQILVTGNSGFHVYLIMAASVFLAFSAFHLEELGGRIGSSYNAIFAGKKLAYRMWESRCSVAG